MEETQAIQRLREFLKQLPTTLDCEYDESVSYLVWKVLNECLESKNNGHDINWDYYTTLILSENWKNGKYSKILTNKDWKDQIVQDHSKETNSHVGKCCTYFNYPNDIVYYCFTCTLNPIYEICKNCFDESKHKGHRYTRRVVTRPEGKICHCGNPKVFVKPEYAYNCKNPANNAVRSTSTNCTYNKYFVGVFNEILDFIINVTISYKDIELNSSLSENKSHRSMNTDNIGKNYYNSNDDIIITDAPEEYLVENGNKYSINAINETWAIQIDEDTCNMTYSDLIRKISAILNKPIEYAISIAKVLESGKKSVTLLHSRDLEKLIEIQVQFCNANLNVSIRKLTDIFKWNLMEDLNLWLHNLFIDPQIDKTIIQAYRLSLISPLNYYDFSNNDLAVPTSHNSGINLLGGFLVSSSDRNLHFQNWKFQFNDDPDVTNIMWVYDMRLTNAQAITGTTGRKILHGSRFQYLLTVCTSILSKLGKYRLLKNICIMFSIMDHIRQCLSAQYIDIYLRLTYHLVSSDSTGFTLNLMTILSQYTYQDPETANMILRSGFMDRTLRYIYMIMNFNPEDLLENLPVVLPKDIRLPKDFLKNNKIIYFFKDLCILLQINTIGDELLQNENMVNTIIDCISQFNNILPLKRETSQHVQYENFDYSSFYFIYLAISMLTENFIRSFTSISDIAVREKLIKRFTDLAVELELKNLYDSRKMILSPSPVARLTGDIVEKISSILTKEAIGNHSADVINFKVGVNTQHFLNPISYLFKFIIQWSICGRYEELSPEIRKITNLNALFTDKQKPLYISESSLCTMVLIGQINVGFWVRNGAPILHQMKIYTKNNLREFTYFSDLYNLQFSMCYADPSDFMVTYLTRWGLKNWSNGIPMGDYPEYDTTVQIVNQCTLLLIQLLTDVRALTMKSSMDGFDKIMKTEIIHAVCFQSCSYNDILTAIADYITKHPSFDLYLKEFTNYLPPSGLNDEGIFTLKEEFIKDVDPYYIGLLPGKRYEAEKLKRLHSTKNANNDYDSTFVPAKDVRELLKGSSFSKLFAITNTDVFGVFLKHSLDFIIKNKHDQLLQLVTHLIHICVVNNTEGFMKVFWREYAIVNPESCYYHSIGSNLYSCLLLNFFSNSQGEIREIFRYISKAAPHINISGYLQEQTPSFMEEIVWKSENVKKSLKDELAKKKEKAKLRQQKLLKKLAKQQQMFIDKNETSNSIDNSNTTLVNEKKNDLSWEYPCDSCVFCKMDREEDILVYLCYQEENICNIGIDFENSSDISTLFPPSDNISTNGPQTRVGEPQISKTQTGAVLRTCSHASHITCLGNHMKIICSSHNQTTRNIPSSFGFGLLSCPLCNSLCNSFIPIIWPSNTRSYHEFSEVNETEAMKNLPTLSRSLIFTSLKSAFLLLDLSRFSPGEIELVDMVDNILVNTASNIELTMRHKFVNNQKHDLNNALSDQKWLTLRLLSDLKLAILLDQQKISSARITVRSRKDFISRDISNDLLKYGSKLFSNSVRFIMDNKSSNLEELILRQLHKEFFVLAKEILFSSVLTNKSIHLSSFSIDSDDSSNVNHKKESQLVFQIFREYITMLDPSLLPETISKFEEIKQQIHHIIINSLTVFLRRLAIIFFSYFATSNFIYDKDYFREIDALLAYFKLKKFDDILFDFYAYDVRTFVEATQEIIFGNDILDVENYENNIAVSNKGFIGSVISKSDSFRNLKFFKTYSAPNLIILPLCLSDFPIAQSEELTHQAFNEEIGFCLFCGDKIRIQKLSGLHNYQIGECTNHLKNECKINSIYGAILLIKSNVIYISYGLKGSFLPVPYLNEHGESNKDVKNDTPVYFDKSRYLHLLNDIILGNTIPHITFRYSTGTSDIGGWESM